jgi:hypothetical protein
MLGSTSPEHWRNLYALEHRGFSSRERSYPCLFLSGVKAFCRCPMPSKYSGIMIGMDRHPKRREGSHRGESRGSGCFSAISRNGTSAGVWIVDNLQRTGCLRWDDIKDLCLSTLGAFLITSCQKGQKVITELND